MKPSTQNCLFGVALTALSLSALGAGGLWVALSQVSGAAEQAAARAQESAAALVAETHAALTREARLLARDPALVDGLAKSDWATLARGVSPRLAAVTLDRFADFISVLDSAGRAILRVPPLPPIPLPDLSAVSGRSPGLTMLDGHPYVVAVAPVVEAARRTREARDVGFLVIARRLESLRSLAAGASARLDLLFLVDGRPPVSSLEGSPKADWIAATTAGKVRVDGGRTFLIRPADQVAVAGPGRLWVLVPDDSAGRRRALVGWLVVLALCALASAAAALLLRRESAVSSRRAADALVEGGVSDSLGELARRNRELEALDALALIMGRSADLAILAGEMLDAVRSLTRMALGSVHQLDPSDGSLTLIAQRGFTPDLTADQRARPVNGSHVGAAVRTGRLKVAHLDPSSPIDPWLAPLHTVRAYRTQLAMPISVDERIWGVMSLVSQEHREFPPEEVKVLEAVAQQIGQGIERALLLAQMEEQGRRLETLARVGQSLTAVRSLADVLATIVAGARDLMADGAARLALAEGDRLRYAAEAGLLGRLSSEKPGSVAFGEGITGRAAATHQVVTVDRIEGSQDVVGLPWLRAEGFVSGVAIPLLARERLVGVLNVLTRTPHTFSSADMDLLNSFAGHAAVAIDEGRLLAEAQQSAARYRALFEVSGALASSLDLDQILDAIVERCQGLTGAVAAGIFRADVETGLLTYVRATGVSGEFLRGLRVRTGEGTSGRALRERRPVWTADILSDPSIPLSTDTRILVEREGYRGVLSVPIFIKGEPYGGLTVYWWQPHQASVAEIEMMTALGGQAAVAIENARLFADEQSGRASLSALLEVNKKIGLLVPTETLLTGVAEEAMRLLAVDNAGFRLVEGDELVVAGLAGTAPASMLKPRLKVGESLAGKIVAEGRAIVGHLDSLPEILPEHLLADRRLGYTHYMGVPLRLGDRITGVLTFRARRAFSRRDQEVAVAFAGQAAVAIEHARLYNEAARQTERLRALMEMGRALVSTVDAERILSLVAAQTKDALGVAVVAVHVHDPDVDLLRFVRHSGEPHTFTGTPLVEPGEGVSGRAFVERRPVWTSDIINDPEIRLRQENRERIVTHGWRAALALPLMRAEPFGTLTVYHATGHCFGQDEIEYLSTVASQLMVALDNARLFEAVQVRANRLRSLVRLNQLVSSSLDADEVLAGIASAAAALMAVPAVSVWVTEGESKTLRLRAFSDAPMGATYPFRAIAFGQGPIGSVALRREALTINDALADGGLLAEQWWRDHALTSFHGEPIVLEQTLLGVLALCGRAAFRLDRDERALLESFVAQAAVAIRNAGLHAQTTQRLQQTRALLEVAEILNSTLEPRRMLKQVVQRIALVCGVDRCSIELWEGDHVIPLMSQFADGRREPELWRAFETAVDDLPREVPIHAQAIRTRRPAIVPDASATDLIPRAWVQAFRIKSYMVVPLVRQDAVIGVMSLDYTERVTPFEPWQQDLGMAIGNQMALALENQRLYDLVQERLQEATTLLAVSQALSGPEGTREALRRVAAEVGRALGADMVGVYTLSADRSAMVPAAGWHVPKALVDTFLARPFVLDRMPAFRPLLNEGRAAWSADVKNDPRIDQQVFEGIGSHSVLFAPALAGGEPVGAVFLVWWETGRSFTPQEVRLIEGVASQVGLFMDNVSLTRQTRLRLEESEALLSELSVLHDLARAVTGQLRQDDVVEAIHGQVARLFDARHMVLAVMDGASAELVALLRMQDGARDADAPRRSLHDRTGLMVDIAASGRPIRTDDYVGECVRRGLEPAPGNESLPYWIGVPMLAGSQVVGVLALRSGDRPFSEADERSLTNIAGLAALALRSARLYQDRTRAFEDLALAQDRLVRSENLRALGEMASGVAHDFNNLLAAILGRAQLLLQRVTDPTAREWIQIVERSATDGAETVRRLQEFARVRRDEPAVAVDLNKVVREALELNETAWRLEPPRRGIVIHAATELAADLPPTISDPAELREVMSSLIVNAVEAMPSGGTLMLSTARRGDSIEVRVADTGIGIPEAVLGKIFDPFFTTKGPTRAGLGLSMTYGILLRHGAAIAVDSQDGRGTTFTLSFPVGAPGRAPGPDGAVTVPAAPLRCLVVDDDELVGDMLADVLRSAGHTVAVVRSPFQGLSRARREPFDLVFSDLRMPGMTGWELARAVRDAVPDLPVILISGFAVEVSRDELQASGVHSVLAKPVSIDAVLTVAASIGSRGFPGGGQP